MIFRGLVPPEARFYLGANTPCDCSVQWSFYRARSGPIIPRSLLVNKNALSSFLSIPQMCHGRLLILCLFCAMERTIPQKVVVCGLSEETGSQYQTHGFLVYGLLYAIKLGMDV